MPAVPSCLLEPLREQFLALLPDRHIEHPLSCHRPRIDDRIVFDKLAEVLVDGAGYEQRVADSTCSATTLRRRRDEWIRLGIWLAVLLTVAVALLIVGSPSVAGATQHQNAYMYTYWNWSPAGSFGQNLDQEHPRPVPVDDPLHPPVGAARTAGPSPLDRRQHHLDPLSLRLGQNGTLTHASIMFNDQRRTLETRTSQRRRSARWRGGLDGQRLSGVDDADVDRCLATIRAPAGDAQRLGRRLWL